MKKNVVFLLLLLGVVADAAAAAATKDYYKILGGVKRGANGEQIRKAYHRMAMKYHPDKNPDHSDAAKQKFIEITEAYEILSAKAGTATAATTTGSDNDSSGYPWQGITVLSNLFEFMNEFNRAGEEIAKSAEKTSKELADAMEEMMKSRTAASGSGGGK